MVEVKGLVKVFKDKKRGKFNAVDNVSFACQPGKIFGLLGANGAGKTTTLRMISTVMKPNQGTIEVDGIDAINEPQKVRGKIGFLTGNTGLYERLTAKEVIRYFGNLNGMTNAQVDERMSALNSWLKMEDFMGVKCSKLSSGMAQKVNIARTIIHDPQVIVFDEPTVGLDIIAARSIIEFIDFCKSQSKSIIFSTHIMREAERICDDVAIIHKGQIRAFGTVESLKETAGEAEFEDAFIKIVGE